MRLLLFVLTLFGIFGPPPPVDEQPPDCNHGVVCPLPSVCTFLEIPVGSGTGEWFCVTSLGVKRKH